MLKLHLFYRPDSIMSNFLTTEWEKLCEQTRQSARYHVERCPELDERINGEQEQFCSEQPPSSYSELLQRTTSARDLAVGWMDALAASAGTNQ
jgi:hypothetical protein